MGIGGGTCNRLSDKCLQTIGQMIIASKTIGQLVKPANKRSTTKSMSTIGQIDETNTKTSGYETSRIVL